MLGAANLGGCSTTSVQSAGVPFVHTLTNARRDSVIIAPQYRTEAIGSLAANARRGVHPLHSLRYVFATDYGTNKVDRWRMLKRPDGSKPSPWYKAVSEPQGLADANGSLLIANTDASNILEVDAVGKLTRTFRDPREFPVNLATAKDKLYVANIFTRSFGPGDVVFYDGGADRPSGSLKNSTFYQVIGIAVDRAGDVFVNNNTQDFAGGEVVEYAGGTGKGSILTNIIVNVAGGLAIDPKSQDLLVVDQSSATVSVYAPPYTGSAVRQYSFPAVIEVALDATGSNLYCSNPNGYIDVYQYPSGSFEGSYADVYEPIGVAVQPPAGS